MAEGRKEGDKGKWKERRCQGSEKDLRRAGVAWGLHTSLNLSTN